MHNWAQAPASVPAARRELRQTLHRWGLTDLTDDSVLVLSELLTNAVEHARGPDGTVGTRFSRLADGRGVRIEVLDADARRLPRMGAGEEGVRGRGLHLVDACTARRWGVVLGTHGKAVWGEVAR
jgi:anti-sigma regulatory factor (Ser/Thr protein kinase)